MVLPWFLCGVLTTVVLALLVKIRRLHTSLDEIGAQLGERLSQDTNTLISLSSGKQHIASKGHYKLRKVPGTISI